MTSLGLGLPTLVAERSTTASQAAKPMLWAPRGQQPLIASSARGCVTCGSPLCQRHLRMRASASQSPAEATPSSPSFGTHSRRTSGIRGGSSAATKMNCYDGSRPSWEKGMLTSEAVQGESIDHRVFPAYLLPPGSTEPSRFPPSPRTRVLEDSPGLTGSLQLLREAEASESGRSAAVETQSGVDEVWLRIREEARECAQAEPFLASYFYSAVLAHPTLERALAFHLANKLSSPTLLATQLKELFTSVLCGDPRIQDAVRADLKAIEARDPACHSLAEALLNYKGFLACQTHRIAHRLWGHGRVGLAMALANRVSEVFHMEIHPAARLGKGLMFDHATGVVIGETAWIGDNVSILHRVTLGGTGCVGGLRHPQVQEGVLIGAGAKLLGPITVGAGAKVGACSVVLENVPPKATVVGNPGKVMMPKEAPANQQQQQTPSAPPSETMDHCFADWVI